MHCLHFIGHKNNFTVNNAAASIIQFFFFTKPLVIIIVAFDFIPRISPLFSAQKHKTGSCIKRENPVIKRRKLISKGGKKKGR